MCRILLICGVLAGLGNAHGQWVIQQSNTTSDLRGIDAVDGSVAWAGGTNDTVLRTVDGGKHWQHCADPAAGQKLDFRAVQAFDSEVAIVMSAGKGGLSRLYRTVDGCTTWRLVLANSEPDGFWDALSFSRQRGSDGKREGVLVGDPVRGAFQIFVTSDSGETWRPWGRRAAAKQGACGEREASALQEEGLFAASNQAALAWSANNIAFVSNTAHEVQLWSSDFRESGGSQCWTGFSSIRLPLAGGTSSSGAFAFAAQERERYLPLGLMVVGGDYKKQDEAGTSAFVGKKDGKRVSFQSGFKVSSPVTPLNGYRSSVAYDVGHNRWIAVGPNGTDVTSDDGQNWRALRPASNEEPDADKKWNALSLPFAVGPGGRVGKLREAALQQ